MLKPYRVENTFSAQQVTRYKAVFKEDQVAEYQAIFQGVPSDALESKASLGRILCKVVGVDKNLDNQFRYAIGKGTSCSPQESYKIAEFKRPLEYHLENLSLVTPKSKQTWAEDFMSMNLTGVDLVPMAPGCVHNIELYQNIDLGFVFDSVLETGLSPIILKEFQGLCVSRFSEFTFLNVPDLEVILHYLTVFPLESSIIVAPYIVTITTLPLFLICSLNLNYKDFFRSLFENAINSINDRPLSWRDCLNHRTTHKLFSYLAMTTGSGAIFFGLFSLSQMPAIKAAPPPITQIKVDPLECYRFTGRTGPNIIFFRLCTGGVLVTVLETFNCYRDIVITIYVNPWTDYFWPK